MIFSENDTDGKLYIINIKIWTHGYVHFFAVSLLYIEYWKIYKLTSSEYKKNVASKRNNYMKHRLSVILSI